MLSRDMEDMEKILLVFLEMKTTIFKMKDTLLEISGKWEIAEEMTAEDKAIEAIQSEIQREKRLKTKRTVGLQVA